MNVQAQEWEIGLQGGASGYMGDINPENPLAFNDWSAAAFVKYNFNHTWGLRGNFAYANLFAHDFYSSVQQRQNRYLGFFGAVKEAALLVDFNFFKWLPQRGRIVYTPYIFAGIGGILFDPKWRSVSGNDIKLRHYYTEGVIYQNKTITIPFGAGFKYNLRGPWTIGAELGYRMTLTDYLDDVSGDYFDYDVYYNYALSNGFAPVSRSDWGNIANPSNSPIGSQRGDGRPYDSFMTVGITLSYTIFKGGCPEWR
ncbi:hypothetical protein SAMN05421740_102624 [Parapedobacter koreensis]|uniref:DUF6089 domain-containing protein n=2 Tax=Parapedobacter koreensis TaxID=332977 RepID=A0A1H7JQJ6_9SPHI|nr:hypothetical protein SAMN05421740_102624 [Parapedobacter koreensis]